MIEAFLTLNGITADGLQDALRQAGFRIVKVALSSEAVHIPAEAAHLPLSQVAISGIKLLAIADGQPAPQPAARGEQPSAACRAGRRTAAGQPRHAAPRRAAGRRRARGRLPQLSDTAVAQPVPERR